MSARITKEGTYELFEDTDGKQVLDLEGEQVRLVRSPRGEVMAHRHDDFERETHLDRGQFKFIDFDEEDREDPRLLLEREGDFQVVLFTEGLPGEAPDEVYARFSEEVVGLDEVEAYVQSLKSGALEGRNRLADAEPVTALDHHLQTMDFPAEKAAILEHAHRRQAAEYVIETLRRLDEGRYESRRDVLGQIKDLDRRLQ